jgi:carboxypeptidase T
MHKIAFVLGLLLFSQFSFANYKTYGEIQDAMRMLAAKNPTIVTMFDVGVSDNGDMIQGLKFGSGAIHTAVIGTHHGNEYGSTELAMGFANDLVTNPIPGQTVYVVPVVNIPGFNSLNRYEVVKGRSYDPNRDYPGPCSTEGPFKLKSTTALAAFEDKENIISLATLHTYSPAVVYPWGIASQDLSTPYTAEFTKMVQDATVESKYEIGNSTEVIYPADGTFEDYSFWKYGTWSILFELGYSHSPNETDVRDILEKNIPGLHRMLLNAPKVRAANHAFNGKCDSSLKGLDRHNE